MVAIKFAFLFFAHARAQSTGGNWTVPFSLNEWRVGDKTTKTWGSHVDVNGDSLPDIVVESHDYLDQVIQNVALATYLNTGNGYCVAYESAFAAGIRASKFANIPSCSSVPSMTMHDPKEDKRVTQLLASIGLEEYAPAFAEHKVDYETLLELSDGQLKEIGVRAVGARARIVTKQRFLRPPITAAQLKSGDARHTIDCPTGNATDYTPPLANPDDDHDDEAGEAPVWATVLTRSLESDSGLTSVQGGQLVDLNGDGLPDIIHSHYRSGGAYWETSTNCVYINTGCGWVLSGDYNKSTAYCQ